MLQRVARQNQGTAYQAMCHQGRGIDRALFQDATRRLIHAADTIGIPGLLVHALSPPARAVFLHLGLDESPLLPTTLMARIADLRAGWDP